MNSAQYMMNIKLNYNTGLQEHNKMVICFSNRDSVQEIADEKDAS